MNNPLVKILLYLLGILEYLALLAYDHKKKVTVVASIITVTCMVWWSITPQLFDPYIEAQIRYDLRDNADTQRDQIVMPIGYTTTSTIIKITDSLLHKPGGYLTNDRLSPAILMDNMPNWEYGALTSLRDAQIWLRNEASRAQTNSTDNKNLEIAQPAISFDNNSWILPRTETQYEISLKRTVSFLDEIGDYNDTKANFYARADNLANHLSLVSKRLGSLSKRLSYSSSRIVINTDVDDASGPDETGARSAKPDGETSEHKTPWVEIDDVLNETIGYSYSELHILKALRHDFNKVLKKKAALATLNNIINELEFTQDPVKAFVVLNGSPKGYFANHSLVWSSYISRAGAGVKDLIHLLNNG